MKILLWACLLVIPAVRATQVRLMNIEELVQGSGRIVLAQVESITRETKPSGPPMDKMQLRVLDTLKGRPSETLTVTQLSLSPKSKLKALIQVPTFTAGESVLLFLPTDDQPAVNGIKGLEQGVFRLAKRVGKGGVSKHALISTRARNPRLFQGMKMSQASHLVKSKNLSEKHQKKTLTFDELKQLIRLIDQTSQAPS